MFVCLCVFDCRYEPCEVLTEIYQVVYKIRSTLLSYKESIGNTSSAQTTITTKQVKHVNKPVTFYLNIYNRV